jgi:hypothetical protein
VLIIYKSFHHENIMVTGGEESGLYPMGHWSQGHGSQPTTFADPSPSQHYPVDLSYIVKQQKVLVLASGVMGDNSSSACSSKSTMEAHKAGRGAAEGPNGVGAYAGV